MKRASRIGFCGCILLALVVFVGCSDDDTATNPNPPEPTMAGSIGIYADVDGTSRTLVDTGDQVTFYVIHKANAEDVASSAFSIEAPEGWTRLGATPEFPVSIGNVDTGISIAYGECYNSEAIHIMTLTYQSPGNTPAGAVFKIVPHDNWPDNIQVVDCELNYLEDGVGEVSPVVQQ